MASRLRLDAIRRSGFDAHVARLGGGTLTRAEGSTYLETDRLIEDVIHELALAGVRVTLCQRIPVPEAGLRPAIGLDLAPLDSAIAALDVVEVRWVSLGDASAVLMRRRLPWLRVPHTARAACRRLLRDEDAVLAWRRVLWCSGGSLREARSRLRLRPVVFDHAALDRTASRWTYASAGAIERWAFA